MQEVFEKIKQKLGERRKEYEEASEKIPYGVQQCYYKGLMRGYEYSSEIVDEVAEEYNNGWIPCSERLPECEEGWETEALLFQLKGTDTIECGYYGVGGRYRDKYFRTYRDSKEGYDARDVIAWQPRPKPYKKEV